MALSKDGQVSETDERVQMLKEALKCVTGTLDFEKLATKMGVANGEAMRKRLKRFFEKDGEPLQLKGSTLGGGEDGAAALKTPRTPRSKAAKPGDAAESNQKIPNSQSTSKKRKAISNAEENDYGDAPENTEVQSTPTPFCDEGKKTKAPSTTKSPTKKAKSAKSVLNIASPSSREPQTPGIADGPETRGAPRTPKSTFVTKMLSKSAEEVGHTSDEEIDKTHAGEQHGVGTDSMNVGDYAI